MDQVGLFGVTDGATIMNVTLEGVQVVNRKNSTTTGVLVGTALSTTQIINVKVTSGELAYLGTWRIRGRSRRICHGRHHNRKLVEHGQRGNDG